MTQVMSEIKVVLEDITTVQVDVIVNAANNALAGGGGVDGAIHKAGGPSIMEECKKIVEKEGGCGTGEAVVTTAGNLPAKYVIHTVGPVWKGGEAGEREKLADCYQNSLQLALDKGCKSIAFPNISTGVYGFPKEEAARIAVETVVRFVTANNSFREILFVCFDEENFKLTKKYLNQ